MYIIKTFSLFYFQYIHLYWKIMKAQDEILSIIQCLYSYSKGQLLFPIAAKNPHRLNKASKKQNHAKNSNRGLRDVVNAQISKAKPAPALIRRPELFIFLLCHLTDLVYTFFVIRRYKNQNKKPSMRKKSIVDRCKDNVEINVFI